MAEAIFLMLVHGSGMQSAKVEAKSSTSICNLKLKLDRTNCKSSLIVQ